MHAGCTSSCCYAPLDDVWVWTAATTGRRAGDPLKGEWAKLPQASDAPSARLYHTISPLVTFSGSSAPEGKGAAVLIGGSNSVAGFLSDAWLLRTTGLGGGNVAPQWTKIQPTSGTLPPRGGHSATVVESTLSAGLPAVVVIGGRNLVDVLDDVWVLEASGDPADDPAGWKWSWRQVNATGGAFQGLVNHVAAGVPPAGSSSPSHITVVGGTSGLGEDSADVLLLSLASARWSAVAPTGDDVGKRHGSVAWAALTAGSDLTVFGGQAGVDGTDPYLGDLLALTLHGANSSAPAVGVRRMQNSTFSPTAERPNARVNAAGSAQGGGAWLFGGFSGYGGGLDDRLHNDLWLLE